MARTLRAPSGVTSFTTNGSVYEVGEDGFVDVSEAHEKQLVEIGFLREDRFVPEPFVPEEPALLEETVPPVEPIPPVEPVAAPWVPAEETAVKAKGK